MRRCFQVRFFLANALNYFTLKHKFIIVLCAWSEKWWRTNRKSRAEEQRRSCWAPLGIDSSIRTTCALLTDRDALIYYCFSPEPLPVCYYECYYLDCFVSLRFICFFFYHYYHSPPDFKTRGCSVARGGFVLKIWNMTDQPNTCRLSSPVVLYLSR